MRLEMRAMQIRRFGPSAVLEETTLADPTRQQGQVVVEIAAAGVNFANVLTRAGRAPGGRSIPLPAVLGSEGGGVVVATDAGVDSPKVGSTVVAGTGGLGGYAQLARVRARRSGARTRRIGRRGSRRPVRARQDGNCAGPARRDHPR
jgi:NADPH2:quinone reductase